MHVISYFNMIPNFKFSSESEGIIDLVAQKEKSVIQLKGYNI